MNYNMLNPKEGNAKKFKSCLKEHNLSTIDIPVTRITPTTATSIDLCLTNTNASQIRINTHSNTLSDHLGMSCKILNWGIQKQNFIKKKIRPITQENLKLLKFRLGQQTWAEIYETKLVDDKYNAFVGILQYELDLIMPSTTKNYNIIKKCKFWDNTTEKLLNAVKVAHNKFILTNKEEDKYTYTSLKKRYDLHIKSQKSTYLTTKIDNSQNKTKEVWKIINNERKADTRKHQEITLKVNDENITDPRTIGDLFNNFFVNIGTNSTGPNLKTTYETDIPDTLASLTCFKKITETQLKNIFKNFEPKTSSGTDSIPNKIIKFCQEEILHPLLDIINSSISQETVPKQMKIGLVYPKYKKGNQQAIENYRPISVMPTLSKYLEKVIYNQLIDFLEKEEWLTENQHGFRKRKSINTALNQLCNSITQAWEGKNHSSGIFLDLQKAFDSLDRQILLQKISEANIKSKALNWIQNYLTDRNQIVEISHIENNTEHKTQSCSLSTTSGIPQGSVLGPLFFLIYINAFPQNLTEGTECIMFADDTTLLTPIAPHTNPENSLNITLKEAKTFCNSINLQINTSKSIHLKFKPSNNNEEPAIPLQNIDLPHSETTTFLGVTIDHNLSWLPHIEKLHNKLATILYALRRLRTITNKNTALTAYHALFASHLRFGIVAWGGACDSQTIKIFILQKKAVKIINQKHQQEHCKILFQQDKILTLTSIYILEILTLLKQNPPDKRTECHKYQLRNETNYNLPHHRLHKTSRTPTFMGIKIFNSLPEKLKIITEDKKFFRELKKYLLDKAYYSLKEYFEGTKEG